MKRSLRAEQYGVQPSPVVSSTTRSPAIRPEPTHSATFAAKTLTYARVEDVAKRLLFILLSIRRSFYGPYTFTAPQ